MTAPSVASFVFRSVLVSVHGHRLGERADLERDVQPRALADFQRHRLRVLLEAAQLDVDPVRPGIRLTNRNDPVSVVCCSDETLVARFVAVTVTPGRSRPPTSVTVPVSVARSTWANARPAHERRRTPRS